MTLDDSGARETSLPSIKEDHETATTTPVSATEALESDQWRMVWASEAFAGHRRAHRRFVFPMTAAFLLWYLLYVLLADYAHGFMAIRLIGVLNVGILMGLLQVISTLVITTIYLRYADRRLDPEAARLRAQLVPVAVEDGTAPTNRGVEG